MAEEHPIPPEVSRYGSPQQGQWLSGGTRPLTGSTLGGSEPSLRLTVKRARRLVRHRFQSSQTNDEAADPVERLTAALAARGDFPDAIRQLKRALRELGDRPDAELRGAAIRSKLAQVLRMAGDIAEATRVARTVLDSRIRHLSVAHPETLRARRLLAALLGEAGEFDSALAHLREVAAELEAEGAEIDAADTRAELATVLRRTGNLTAARKEAELVLEIRERLLARHHPDSLRARQELATILTDSGAAEEAVRHLRLVVRGFDRQSGTKLAASDARYQLALSLHRAKEYREAHSVAREVLRERSRSRNLGAVSQRTFEARMLVGQTLTSLGSYPDAEAHLTDAADGFDRLGNLASKGEALYHLAELYRSHGEERRALGAAVRAVGALDLVRYALGRSDDRLAWFERLQSALRFALELADPLQDAPLIAELVECGRLQGVPVPTSHPRDAIGATATSLLHVPVAPPPPLSVGGTSRLGNAELNRRGIESVALEHARVIVGGADSWWWGTFDFGDRLWWALVTPDNAVSAGQIDLSHGCDLANALNTLEKALPIALEGESSVERADRLELSVMCSRPDRLADRDAELAATLGLLLVPAALRSAIASSASREELLPLTIAPSQRVARVPFPWLGVTDMADAHVDPVRVLEGAVVRISPPAGLVLALFERWPQPRLRRRQLALAVANPANDPDLYASSAPPEAEVVLGPDSNRRTPDRSERAAPASRANLVEMLRRIQAGTGATPAPAVMTYTGHAFPPPPGEPASARVQLASGEWLYAHDLLCDRDFCLPEHVLLAACETSGLNDSGGGEWLTLAPAALCAGAATVVATLWPQPNTFVAARADDEVARALMSADDPAVALRRFQEIRLGEWRAQPDEGSAPVLWANYQAVTRCRTGALADPD